MHILLTVSMALALAYSVTSLIVRRRRGDVAIMRQGIPAIIGLAFLLVGNVLRGGPHDGVGDLLMLVGGLIPCVSIAHQAMWREPS